MSASFSFRGTVDSVINDGLIAAVSGTAGIFIFLVELVMIVALINKAGGSAAFGNWAKTHIKSRVGAMLATFVLGVLIFVAGICGLFSIKPRACHTLGCIIMLISLASLVYAVVMQKTFDFNIANQFLLSWLFMLCV